jgi:hypothetical protein
MNDITLLARHAPVLGAEPSDTTVRRTLELADPATLDKIARVRVRAHVWKLICATPAGFPWLAVAGKLLDGWLVIDLDATLITARSPAPTFKKGYGFHPLGGLAGEHHREPGDAAAARQRRLQHRRRSHRRAGRGGPPDPGPLPVPAAGARRRGRRQP